MYSTVTPLQIDTTVSTLNDLLRLVLKGRLSFNSPTLMQGKGEGGAGIDGGRKG